MVRHRFLSLFILLIIFTFFMLSGTASAQPVDLSLEPREDRAVVGDNVAVDIVAHGVDEEQGLKEFTIFLEFDDSANYTNYTLPRPTEEEPFVGYDKPGVVPTWELRFLDITFSDKSWSQEDITLATFYVEGVRAGETNLRFLSLPDSDVPELIYNDISGASYEIGELINASIEFRERDFVDFRAEINRQNSRLNVSEGDNVSVSANVTNIGTTAGSQDIEMEIDDVFNDTYEDLTLLKDGDSETIDFQDWTTTEGDADNYTLVIRTLNDTITSSIEVFKDPDPGYFEVSINKEASTLNVSEGEKAVIVADISNTGDLDASQQITLGIDGVDDEVDTQELNISGDANETMELTWNTNEGQTGEFTAQVSSENESATITLQVEESGSLLGTVSEILGDYLRYIVIVIIIIVLGILSVFVIKSSSIGLETFKSTDGDSASDAASNRGTVQEFDMSNDVFRSWTELIGYLDIDNPKAKTPEEVEKIAIQHGLDRGKVRDLVNVYEEVLYGDATVTREQEERARRAIESLKVDLRDRE